MDEIVKAAKETLDFSCGIDENFEERLKQVSRGIAQRHDFDGRADGLIAILIRHPKATQEWLDSIDYGNGEYDAIYGNEAVEDRESAVNWLKTIAGMLPHKDVVGLG